MKNVIKKLRGLVASDAEVWDDNYEEILSIIEPYGETGYSVKEVHNEFEEGGRWSNYRSSVFKVEYNGETAYFRMVQEVPASEMQEGMDLVYYFLEVVPKEVTVIEYVEKREECQ